MKIKKVLNTIFAVMLMTGCMSFCATTSAYADAVDDYEITDCWIDYDSQTGVVIAEWEKPEKKTKKVIFLKRESKAIIDGKEVSGTTYTLTEIIAKSGTGKYTFSLYPKELGSNYKVSSETLEVSTEMLKLIKARVEAEKSIDEAKKIGWYHDGPNGVWRYYKSAGVMVKNDWAVIDGKTYHFTKDGVMQTGWQVINDRWYYFDSSGALLKNTTTPDGYRVNASGAWVDEAGNEISVKAQTYKAPKPTTLSKCVIGVTEAKVASGQVKTATFGKGTGFNVSDVIYSVEPSKWKAGSPVEVSLTATAENNYTFSTNVQFSVRNSKDVSSTGTQTSRRVRFRYYPKVQLETPTHLYIDGNDILRWDKVEDATQYKVEVYRDGTRESSTTVEKNEFDVSNYLYEDEDTICIKISASSKKNSSNFNTSAVLQIDDLIQFASTNTVDGNLKWSNSGLKYTDSSGDKMTGWQQIMGYWYHFDKKGQADGPGWWQDSDGNWYYFDSEYRMCTGWINDGKADYFMNDGSVANLPIGAWKR